jgi:methyl-accepting chemotaxis protein
MRLQFPRAILLSALLLASAGLLVAQEPLDIQPKLSQSEAQSLIKDLAAQELEIEQSHHRVAAIYREMAAPAESDSASTRETKRQYERLAENEEKAAATAKKLAARYARLAAVMHDAPDATKSRSLWSDSAYRR